MPVFKDLTMQTQGRLTALRCVGKTKWGNAIWTCLCLCGIEVEVTSGNFVSGHTLSCGCLHDEMSAARGAERCGAKHPMFGRRGKETSRFKHGYSQNSSMYRSWVSMMTRCKNPKATGYENYGGAGITVCERWLNSFEAFLEDMGERPAGTSLGRFGDVGNYEKSNCAWQTRKEQGAERRIKNQRKLLAA